MDRVLATLIGLRDRLNAERTRAQEAQAEATEARRKATLRVNELGDEIGEVEMAITAIQALMTESPPS